jgi:hypothetical protein
MLAHPSSRHALTKQLADAAVVIAAMVFVVIQMRPGLLLADTTPAGGDMGAHVWAPAFLRDHLLPDLRLSGWTPDWYAGFPAMHFYMVVPMLAIVALDSILPYGVAFKLVTVSGVVAMPAAAYLLGKLAGVRFPGPALMALAAVLFVFDRSFSIYGGNIPSTLAGEFAFSISLAFALAFLGVFAHSLRTGRHRSLAAVLLALTALNHLIPAIFAAMGAVSLLIVVTVDDHLIARRGQPPQGLMATLWRPAAARARLLATVGVVGGAIGAFWALPFVWRRAYLNDMGWGKLTDYGEQLFPDDLRWVLALAVAGGLISVVLRIRAGMALVLLAAMLAVAFVLIPQGRLWNARLLPFFFLVLYLLAGLAIGEVLRALAQALTPDPTRPIIAVTTGGLALVVGVTFVFVGRPLGVVPDAVPFDTADRSYIPSWVRWNYSGYERKDAYPEYHSIVTTMQGIGEERGCGRAMWEYEKGLDRYGTPMALMLLPHWTDGCIGSMEGLYFEASATTPYHFLTQSELSAGPSRPQRDLPYRTLLNRTDTNADGIVDETDGGEIDHAVFDAGIQHLQLLGVRYYLAFTGPVIDSAHEHPDLTFVGRSTPWEVFEVADTSIVEPLTVEPVVVPGLQKGGRVWQDAAVAAYQEHDGDDDVLLAAGGPDSWARLSEEDALATPPQRRLPSVRVSDVAADTDGIAFDVDRTGVPILVKTSYFPNWRADGADGPYRVSPNLMVVVPTEEHVELHYGRTPVDIAAWLITLLGIAAAWWLWRRGPADLHLPELDLAPAPEPDEAHPDPVLGTGHRAGEQPGVPRTDGWAERPPDDIEW